MCGARLRARNHQIIHADDSHESANWQRPQTKLDFAALKTKNFWPHTHIELRHFHAAATRGQKVTNLVQKYRNDQASHEHQRPRVLYAQPCQQPDDDNRSNKRRQFVIFVLLFVGRATSSNLVAKFRIKIAVL